MKTILIVDDDKSVRESLKMILEYDRYEVEFAENGEQGLQQIGHLPVDVVLLDVKMSGMDGIEVLTKIRQKNTKLPVIMIQGMGQLKLRWKRRSWVHSIFFQSRWTAINSSSQSEMHCNRQNYQRNMKSCRSVWRGNDASWARARK